MRERSGFLAAFLGLGALLYHAAGPANQIAGSGTKTSVSANAVSSEDHAGDWELLKNLNDFYLLDGKPPAEADLTGRISEAHGHGATLDLSFTTHGAGSGDGAWTKKLKDKYDWTIATVPDPELSEMKLDFDREINSVQNAVEAGGYQFDRYWFPWKADASISATGTSEAASKDEQLDRRKLPGLLLFRKPRGAKRDLAVFLVGETPTSGIVPDEFRNAIRFGKLSRCEVPLRIAGPGFSGSFASLAGLLDRKEKALVNTWTADSGSQSNFQSAYPGVTLSATNDSTFEAIGRFCVYLRRRWHENGPVVLLVEESTAFGSGLIRSLSDITRVPELDRVYVLTFPRGISKLRNATAVNEQIPGFSDKKGGDLLRRELPLTLKDEQIGSSEVPFYSKEQTPVSQEAVLLSIASLIKKSSLHYAGIFASDPLDLLFLSRFLRSASPNTRLFTNGADLLFQHGSDGSEYKGILNVTNYPLIPFNQAWTRSNRDAFEIFPSATSESIYNAVVQLLPDGIKSARLREYGNPFAVSASESKPPLWITVASGNGYAPVDVLGDLGQRIDPTGRYLKAIAQERPSKAPSGARWTPEYWDCWGYCFGLIWCLAVVYSACVLGARPRGNGLFAIFSVKAAEPAPLRRAMYLFLIGLCLSALIAMWLAVPYIVMVQNATSSQALQEGWQAGVVWQGIAGVGLAIAAGLLVRCRRGRHLRFLERRGFAFVTLIAILFSSRSMLHYVQIGNAMLLLLHYGGAVAVGAAAAGTLQRAHGAAPATFPSWRKWVFGLSIVTLAFAIASCYRPPVEGSGALLRLGRLLYGGAAVLGFSATAAVFPLVEGMAGAKKQTGVKTYKLLFDGYLRGSIAFAAVAMALFVWMATEITYPDPQQFLAACRSLNLTSGVCPLVPLTLSILACAFWCFIALRRVTFEEDRRPELPTLVHDAFCPKLSTVVRDVERRTGGDFFHPAYNFAGLLGIFIAVSILFVSDHQTLESDGMDRVMLSLAALVGNSLLTVGVRLALIWSAFREFLQELERHPLREVFSYLPRGFLWVPLWQGSGKRRTHVAVTRSVECVRALVSNRKVSPEVGRVLDAELPKLNASMRKLLVYAAQRRRVPALFHRQLQQQLSFVGTVAATDLSDNKWPRGSYEAKAELSNRNETKHAVRVTRDEFAWEEAHTIAGELLALRFVPFINYVLLQMQNLALYLSVGFILLITAMNSYIFRARTVIDWSLAILFLLVGGGVVTAFSQLDRDALFSRITGTEEGKLDSNFFFRLISYGGIPTLALLASHVPVVAKFFFSWIKPALEAIH